MRPLYLFLRFALPYILLVFYKRRNAVGSSNKLNAQTIFACNHPSAFIDPLIIASLQVSIVNFMVRSDVFKTWLKPITWAAHMVPIYRAAEDGKESLKKNKGVFEGVHKTLFRKKSIIIFAEGYTDNVFIRSLKPIKKGPARIGFGAMEACDWKEDIKIQASCVNYSSPKNFRSDVLLSFGESIPLKEYEQEYKENPAQAITNLTRRIAKEMQDNLTYIEDKDLADFLENLLILSRRGMNHENHEIGLTVKEKFNYSRSLSQKINEEYTDSSKGWQELKTESDQYFSDIKEVDIWDKEVNSFGKKGAKKTSRWGFLLFLTFPLFLLGCVHALVPYLLVKTIVEKIFKRPVFWSGVKMLLGSAVFTLYNLPLIWLMYDYVYPSYTLSILYFFSIPALSFIFAYQWRDRLKTIIHFSKADNGLLGKFVIRRNELKAKMEKLGF